MSQETSEDALFLEIALTVLLIVVGCAAFIVARPIPDNAFEPLGAGFAPRAISLCLVGLGALNLAVRATAVRGRVGRGRGGDIDRRLLDAASVLVLTCVYVWIVMEKAIPFTFSTGLFVTASMAVLFRNLRRVPVFAAVGLALGYALQLASSTVFFVDI